MNFFKRQEKTMPSHKEILQTRLTEAQAAHRITSSEVERLTGELKTAQASIDGLQARYEKACRGIAEGNPNAEDPATLLAARDQRSHQVRGIQVLHREAIEADQRANAIMHEATAAMRKQLDAEELAAHEQRVEELKKREADAQTVLSQARQELNDAAWALTRFRSKLERERATA